MYLKRITSLVFCLLIAGCAGKSEQPPVTFQNPILGSAPDPWIYKHTDGMYYFTATKGNRIDVWQSETISDLFNGRQETVWSSPPSGANAYEVWAPEIHYLDGKWYIYYTASNGEGDSGRRIFVLENASEDFFGGEWVDKGALNTAKPGLDGTVFEHKGKRYFLYSGYDPEQSIFLVEMKDPLTLTGPEVLLTKPEFDWEKNDFAVNEGPEILKHDGKIFMVYSASSCFSDDYALGMLTADEDSDLMKPESWNKSNVPVFSKSEANGVYGPGHNSFVKSPDGKEDWIVYHANPAAGMACGPQRSTRIQKIEWNKDGTPNFGVPVAEATVLAVPSGEEAYYRKVNE
jgi:GH43 family beta-xylosidase